VHNVSQWPNLRQSLFVLELGGRYTVKQIP